MPCVSVPRSVEACIFDLDGTLVDSEPNYDRADTLLLRDYGIEYSRELRRYLLGRGSEFFFETIAARYPENPLAALGSEGLRRLHDERYLEVARNNTRAFPSLAGLVEVLHGRGMPLAVASGSSPRVIDWVLRETGLEASITLWISAEEVSAGKPAPDIFLEAARRLGVDPAACLVFEDALPGLLAARAAGMRTVLLPEPGSAHPDFAYADLLVEGGPGGTSAEALLAFVDSLSTAAEAI